ncbi:hypothetical protein D9I81_16420 [Escherichia coli]|nr:hypothetical protein [Escherichia coli]ELF62004.1 hypothetical protein WE3_04194 [Escherichia coli KTE18]EFA4765202.1 hypothetical protein [Escherichia coli]EFH8950843.1 hypothetical protein [Escherichia coli]MHX99091.1 hypothetical protein [Escherichia coli]
MRSAAVINNGLRRYVAYSILNLFVEYWLQCRIVAGFFLMRFLIMYTLMYTVFSGALVRSHCLHPSRSRCVTMFRLVVLRARIAREIAVPNSDVRKNLRSHMKQPYATGN